MEQTRSQEIAFELWTFIKANPGTCTSPAAGIKMVEEWGKDKSPEDRAIAATIIGDYVIHGAIDEILKAYNVEVTRLKEELAIARSQAASLAFRLGSMQGQIYELLPHIYREWRIERAQNYMKANFQYIHVEYDGPHDHRIGTADTILDCKKAIDLYEKDYRDNLEALVKKNCPDIGDKMYTLNNDELWQQMQTNKQKST